MSESGKKGLSPLAWIGIGCGVVVLLTIVGVVISLVAGGMWLAEKAEELSDPVAATEFALDLHPDMDHVSTDRAAGTMTIFDKKKGEPITVNLQDIRDGTFSIESQNGEEIFGIESSQGTGGGMTVRTKRDGEMQIGGASLSNVPEWVPIYPNAGEASNVMNRRKNGKSIGALTFATQDETDAIAEHYRTTLSEAGFTINQESSSFNGNQQVVLTADHPDEGKTLRIIVGGMGAQQTLVINYEEK